MLTNEQLESGLSRICKVICQIPCFHIFEKWIADRFKAGVEDAALKDIMHNAALDSALINLRSLNDFFKEPRREDDVRARDFGVWTGPFLKQEEQTSVDKYLAHITVSGSNIVEKFWFLDDMATQALDRGIDFLIAAETAFEFSHDDIRHEVSKSITAAKAMRNQISSKSV
jgi:hypothetical protein